MAEKQKFQIVTDGSCDLGKERAKENNIKVVPFYVSMDGMNYQKEIEELDIREFYEQMVKHPDVFPKTSLPSIEDYVKCFEEVIKTGIKNIICICITTKFSGSYNSAVTAKSILLEEYEYADITVIDATVNTVLQGILVLEAAKMQQAGFSYEEVINGVERIKESGRIFFTVGSMDYLVHGGRVGKLAGLAAGTLGIKPLILLKEGEIFSNGLARGRKGSKRKVIAQLKEYIQTESKEANDFTIVVGFGYDYEESKEFQKEVQDELRTIGYTNSIEIFQIGATIGVHTGPYPLGCGVIRKYNC